MAQKYEKGTAVREAINLSYRQTQQTLAIASLALAAPLLIMMLFNKNVKLQEEDEKRREAENQAVEEPEVQQGEKQALPRAV